MIDWLIGMVECQLKLLCSAGELADSRKSPLLIAENNMKCQCNRWLFLATNTLLLVLQEAKFKSKTSKPCSHYHTLAAQSATWQASKIKRFIGLLRMRVFFKAALVEIWILIVSFFFAFFICHEWLDWFYRAYRTQGHLRFDSWVFIHVWQFLFVSKYGGDFRHVEEALSAFRHLEFHEMLPLFLQHSWIPCVWGAEVIFSGKTSHKGFKWSDTKALKP